MEKTQGIEINMLGLNDIVDSQHFGSADDVIQLSDIAGPLMRQQFLDSRLLNLHADSRNLLRCSESNRQLANVLRPLAQRGYADMKGI